MTSSLVITTGELAALLGAELRGPNDVRLSGLAPLETAGADDLSFVREARYAGRLLESKAGAALVSRSVLADEVALKAVEGVRGGRAVLIVDDADLAMVRLLEKIAAKIPTWGPEIGIDSSAHVDATVRLGRDVRIGAGVVVGPGSVIGDGVLLHPGVVIGARVEIGVGCVLHSGVVVLDRCVLGREVLLWPGVVVGADGFGFRKSEDGRGLVKIPHVGNVMIGDRVEIGANSAIDRGKFGSTRVGAGTKIDNLVQIGHNCVIGRSCVICGCSGLSGSVVLGDGVTLAGGVGIADNRRIGDGATIGARAGVIDDVPAGETWLGEPARPVRQMLRTFAALHELPNLVGPLKRLLEGSGGGGQTGRGRRS